MGWTAQNWSVQGKYASSSSLKRCCSYWMWKTQSSTWTSLFWAFSSSSFGWPPTLSSATKSRQSDRFLTGLLVLFNVIPGQVCLLLLFHFILCRGAKRTEHIASSVQSCYKSTFTCFTSLPPHKAQKRVGDSVTEPHIHIPKWQERFGECMADLSKWTCTLSVAVWLSVYISL